MHIAGTEAFVLHTRPFRETSLLLDVFCATHGRLGLVARGVCQGKKPLLRATLQPLQYIRFEASQKGELATLKAAEALDAAPRLDGAAALAGFYLNELTLRLAPRQEPMPELFSAYARTRSLLAGAGGLLSWHLRRYERDLLDALGVGFDWSCDVEGEALQPEAYYRLLPERGLYKLQPGARQVDDCASGRALLALAADQPPAQPGDIASLRRPMRQLLVFHLGGRGLKSWEMLGALQRLKPARSAT